MSSAAERELRQSVAACRSILKALNRMQRDAVGMLTDLERRLDEAFAAEDAEPKEAERDGTDSSTTHVQAQAA